MVVKSCMDSLGTTGNASGLLLISRGSLVIESNAVKVTGLGVSPSVDIDIKVTSSVDRGIMWKPRSLPLLGLITMFLPASLEMRIGA